MLVSCFLTVMTKGTSRKDRYRHPFKQHKAVSRNEPLKRGIFLVVLALELSLRDRWLGSLKMPLFSPLQCFNDYCSQGILVVVLGCF